jgi:hypothetical protein
MVAQFALQRGIEGAVTAVFVTHSADVHQAQSAFAARWNALNNATALVVMPPYVDLRLRNPPHKDWKDEEDLDHPDYISFHYNMYILTDKAIAFAVESFDVTHFLVTNGACSPPLANPAAGAAGRDVTADVTADSCCPTWRDVTADVTARDRSHDPPTPPVTVAATSQATIPTASISFATPAATEQTCWGSACPSTGGTSRWVVFCVELLTPLPLSVCRYTTDCNLISVPAAVCHTYVNKHDQNTHARTRGATCFSACHQCNYRPELKLGKTDLGAALLSRRLFAELGVNFTTARPAAETRQQDWVQRREEQEATHPLWSGAGRLSALDANIHHYSAMLDGIFMESAREVPQVTSEVLQKILFVHV